ncbi:unnamed protein product [Toxocara canis]|uniref:LisH domain-containing protein n=1 Tax=Toxocara canis TaxID=6265 RepID=A0A183UBB9_TOXCA|nr:unnamed protein product [Toxocara canis]
MDTMTSEHTDDEEIDLKQVIVDRLNKNGTLNRIQAELRSAIYLAIEENDNDHEIRAASSNKNAIEYSLIYNFLVHNRLPASAAVFEKEINTKLMSLNELRKANVRAERITEMFETFLKSASSSTNENDDRPSVLPPLKKTTNLPSIGASSSPILPSTTSSLTRRLSAVLKMHSASDEKSSVKHSSCPFTDPEDIEEDINVDELLQSNDEDDSISF